MLYECWQPGLDKLFRGETAKLFLRVMNSVWERGEREAEAIAAMLKRNGVDAGSSLLELGAGNGRVAIPLARRGYRVTGVEASEVFVADGQRRVEEAGLQGRVELVLGDVYDLDAVLGDRMFDAAYMTWTSIIGYALSKECDKLALRNIAKHVRPGGLLVVANTASYDNVGLGQGICSSSASLSMAGDELVVVEEHRFDPVESVVTNKWTFYRLDGKDLCYLDEVEFRLRIYTLRELVTLARRADWELVEAVDDPVKATPYKPCGSPFNLVFRRTSST